MHLWEQRVRPGGIVAGHDFTVRRRWSQSKCGAGAEDKTWIQLGENRHSANCENTNFSVFQVPRCLPTDHCVWTGLGGVIPRFFWPQSSRQTMGLRKKLFPVCFQAHSPEEWDPEAPDSLARLRCVDFHVFSFQT